LSSKEHFSKQNKLITGDSNRLGGETVTACECQKKWQVIGFVGDASRRGEADGLKEQTEQHEARLFDDLCDAISDDA
jgi:hypothetical protein